MPESPDRGEDTDVWFVDAKDSEDGASKAVELVRSRIPQHFGLDSIGDTQVVGPRQRVEPGARLLNAELQPAVARAEYLAVFITLATQHYPCARATSSTPPS